MGLITDYPAVRINDPTATVPIWNGAHQIVGSLGPDDYYHSAATNIDCTLTRCNGTWYRRLFPDPGHTYVSSALTHLMYPGPEGYVLGPCPPSSDHPGPYCRPCRPCRACRLCPRCWRCGLVYVGAGLAVIAVVAGLLRRRRRRAAPPDPEESDES